MVAQHALPGCAADRPGSIGSGPEYVVDDVIGRGRDEYFVVGLEERRDALPGIRDHARPTTGGFENARWKTLASRHHVAPVDTQHQARRAVPGPVVSSRYL